jgi:hypothetical protein
MKIEQIIESSRDEYLVQEHSQLAGTLQQSLAESDEFKGCKVL